MKKRATKRKPSRGGRRRGAGRPSLHGDRKIKISVAMPSRCLKWLSETAEKKKLSRSEILTGMILAEMQGKVVVTPT
jgi:hypothetical protein